MTGIANSYKDDKDKVTYTVTRIFRNENSINVPFGKTLFYCSAEIPMSPGLTTINGDQATEIGLVGFFARDIQDVVDVFNTSWGDRIRYDGTYVPLKKATDFDRVVTTAERIYSIDRD